MVTPLGGLTSWQSIPDVSVTQSCPVKKVVKVLSTIWVEEPPLKFLEAMVGDGAAVRAQFSENENGVLTTGVPLVKAHWTLTLSVYPFFTLVWAVMAYGPAPDPVTAMLPPDAGVTKVQEVTGPQEDPVYRSVARSAKTLTAEPAALKSWAWAVLVTGTKRQASSNCRVPEVT